LTSQTHLFWSEWPCQTRSFKPFGERKSEPFTMALRAFSDGQASFGMLAYFL
jgi:hypothetical protein